MIIIIRFGIDPGIYKTIMAAVSNVRPGIKFIRFQMFPRFHQLQIKLCS